MMTEEEIREWIEQAERNVAEANTHGQCGGDDWFEAITILCTLQRVLGRSEDARRD